MGSESRRPSGWTVPGPYVRAAPGFDPPPLLQPERGEFERREDAENARLHAGDEDGQRRTVARGRNGIEGH